MPLHVPGAAAELVQLEAVEVQDHVVGVDRSGGGGRDGRDGKVFVEAVGKANVAVVAV